MRERCLSLALLTQLCLAAGADDDIARQIEALGSDDGDRRSAAEMHVRNRLWDMQAAEVDLLRAASRDPDPERSNRASGLLRERDICLRFGASMQDVVRYEERCVAAGRNPDHPMALAARVWRGGGADEEDMTNFVELCRRRGWSIEFDDSDITECRVRPWAQLIRDNPSPNIESRLVMLGAAGDPSDLEEVLRHADDRNDVVRAAVARALGDFGGEASVKVLRRLALDRSRFVARLAMDALSESGTPLPADDLRMLLDSGDEWIVAAAAEMVTRHGIESLYDSLGSAARKDERGARLVCEIRDRRFRDLHLKGSSSVEDRYVSESSIQTWVATTKPEDLEEVLRLIDGTDGVKGNMAADAAAALDETAEARLIERVRSGRPEVRARALRALGARKCVGACGLAFDSLKDEDAGRGSPVRPLRLLDRLAEDGRLWRLEKGRVIVMSETGVLDWWAERLSR